LHDRSNESRANKNLRKKNQKYEDCGGETVLKFSTQIEP
jgi:hypothetical protein